MTCVDSNRRPNVHCSAKPTSLDKITSEIRGFKIALLYVNSLTKHRDELKVFMANKPPDGLAINESKLDLVDSDQLVNLEGYTIVRRDRNKHGGGVCYYLRNTITFSKQYQLNQYCNISWKYFIKCEWFNVTTGRNCKVSCPHYRPISYLEKSFTKCQTKGGVWH